MCLSSLLAHSKEMLKESWYIRAVFESEILAVLESGEDADSEIFVSDRTRFSDVGYRFIAYRHQPTH